MVEHLREERALDGLRLECHYAVREVGLQIFDDPVPLEQKAIEATCQHLAALADAIRSRSQHCIAGEATTEERQHHEQEHETRRADPEDQSERQRTTRTTS